METETKIKRICVFGAGSSDLDREFYDASYSLGKIAAEKGIGIVYGGGNTGVMGYVARGTVDNGGELIGVAPEFMRPRGVLFERCTQLIYTESMRERKRMMEELSDAFIVMPGGFGTIEEYYEILTAKTLGLHTKPIALVNIRGVWNELEACMHTLLEEHFTNEECMGAYRLCDTPEQALDFVISDPGMDNEPKWMKYVVTEGEALK